LGNTLEEIAMEKAGIMKKRVPVIIGETTPETRMVFDAMSAEVVSPITYAEDDQEIISVSTTARGLEYQTKNFGILTGSLSGSYQEKNTNTILCAIKQLEKMGLLYSTRCIANTTCQNKEVREGFLNVCSLTGLQGRWQKICDTPLTICDTGHNVAGWEYLSKQLNTIQCHRKHIVFGMVDDKDVEGVMAMLPKDAIYYYTKANNKRALSESVVMIYGQNLGLQGNSYPDVATAYRAARNEAENDDFVFIGGSSYIVADFLKNCI
jgi:dihydrofolate synthase/folylpolyglutamate synthase